MFINKEIEIACIWHSLLKICTTFDKNTHFEIFKKKTQKKLKYFMKYFTGKKNMFFYIFTCIKHLILFIGLPAILCRLG